MPFFFFSFAVTGVQANWHRSTLSISFFGPRSHVRLILENLPRHGRDGDAGKDSNRNLAFNPTALPQRERPSALPSREGVITGWRYQLWSAAATSWGLLQLPLLLPRARLVLCSALGFWLEEYI